MKNFFTLILLFICASVFAKDVYVKGYTRSDGTYVAPHYRTSPDSTDLNNYSYSGNINPYTGKVGAKDCTSPERCLVGDSAPDVVNNSTSNTLNIGNIASFSNGAICLDNTLNNFGRYNGIAMYRKPDGKYILYKIYLTYHQTGDIVIQKVDDSFIYIDKNENGSFYFNIPGFLNSVKLGFYIPADNENGPMFIFNHEVLDDKQIDGWHCI